MAISTPKEIYDLWDEVLSYHDNGPHDRSVKIGEYTYYIRFDFVKMIYEFGARFFDQKTGNTWNVTMNITAELMKTDHPRDIQDLAYKGVDYQISGRYDADEAYNAELRDYRANWDTVKKTVQQWANGYGKAEYLP